MSRDRWDAHGIQSEYLLKHDKTCKKHYNKSQLHRFILFDTGLGGISGAVDPACQQIPGYALARRLGLPLLYDLGGVAFGRCLRPLAQATTGSNPELNVFDQGINLHRRLGDETGHGGRVISASARRMIDGITALLGGYFDFRPCWSHRTQSVVACIIQSPISLH